MPQYITFVQLDTGEMITPDHLVQRIVVAAKAVGMTQQSIASRLGVTRMAMYRWVHGHCNPSIEQISKILEIENDIIARKIIR